MSDDRENEVPPSAADEPVFASSTTAPSESSDDSSTSEPPNSKSYFSPHRPFGIKYYFNLTVSWIHTADYSYLDDCSYALVAFLTSHAGYIAIFCVRVYRRLSMTARNIWCICRH